MTTRELEIHVWLSVLSERRTPQEVSALVGIEPDSAWQVGDIRPNHRVPEKRHGWIVRSGLPKTGTTLEAHLESLLGRVRGVADRIKSLADQEETSIMCALYTDQQLVIDWPAWMIHEFSRLGVGVGIDVYYLPQEGRDNS